MSVRYPRSAEARAQKLSRRDIGAQCRRAPHDLHAVWARAAYVPDERVRLWGAAWEKVVGAVGGASLKFELLQHSHWFSINKNIGGKTKMALALPLRRTPFAKTNGQLSTATWSPRKRLS